MKLHRGECPATSLEKLLEIARKVNIEVIEERNKECTLRKVAQENESITALELRHLRKQNEELQRSHTQLEECIAKYQAKIAHLEEVISDYSKASLLEKAPVYVEIVPLPEQEKPKRKAR
jgi:indole-3-glycerol phosphate synthase